MLIVLVKLHVTHVLTVLVESDEVLHEAYKALYNSFRLKEANETKIRINVTHRFERMCFFVYFLVKVT